MRIHIISDIEGVAGIVPVAVKRGLGHQSARQIPPRVRELIEEGR